MTTGYASAPLLKSQLEWRETSDPPIAFGVKAWVEVAGPHFTVTLEISSSCLAKCARQWTQLYVRWQRGR